MTGLSDAVALITGASRGIGAAVARELAAHGAHCIITARTQGGLEETDDAIRAAGGSATLIPLDLDKSAEQIDLLGPSIVERFGRLDILVHAAGLLPKLTPSAHIEPKDWQASLAVNLSALWRLIRTADPALRAAPAGRAVVMTDSFVRAPHAYFGLYSAPKAAAAHLAQCWAAEVASTPLRVNLVEPRPTATRLRRAAFPGEDSDMLPMPADIAPAIAALCLPAETRHGATIAV